MPLLLQMAVVIAAEQLTTAYKNRAPRTAIRISGRGAIPSSRPSPAPPGAWPRCSGSCPDSFPAQAYLGAGLPGHDGDGIHRPLGAPPRLSGAHPLVAGAAGRAAAAAGRALCRHDRRSGRAVCGRADQLLPRHGAAARRKRSSAQRKWPAGDPAAARKARGALGARRRPSQRAWPNPPSSPISATSCARR